MNAIFGRVIWLGLCAAGAATAIGLELDREARHSLPVAGIVPEPFRAFALETLAHDAYDSGNVDAGLAYSRQMVRRRPVPAEGLSLLAYGQLQRGDEKGALGSILLAGQRSWRDRFTQDMLIMLGLQSGEWTVTAQRVVALWRLGNTDDRLKDMTAELLSHPEGVDAFAQQLSQEKFWATSFLLWAGSNLEAPALEKIGGAMAGHGARVDCAQLSTKVLALVRIGRAASAATLWQEMCSNGRSVDPADFAFNDDNAGGQPIGPFDWQYPEQPGLERELVQRNGSTIITYENRNAVRTVIAKRNAVLPAGGHMAKIEGTAKGEAGFRPLVLRISCYSADGTAYRLADAEIGGEPTDFTIPQQDCASQELAILSSRGSGEIRKLVIAPH